MPLGQRWRFARQYLREPNVVGALAPSSSALALALCEPFRRRTRPARVLEVGAGTGAITRHIGPLLGDHDELDVCEIQPSFADILEREVLAHDSFASARAQGRLRVLCKPVQELTQNNHYDFVISGLPLTAFAFEDLQAVLATIRRSLRPGGVFSYFEYVALRRASRLLSFGGKRRRIQRVSAYLSEHIREHQFDREIVLRNFPPAHARHLRFEPSKGSVASAASTKIARPVVVDP